MKLKNLTTYSQDDLRSFLSRRHPDYEGSLESWEFFEATYKGGSEWFKDNIHTYHKEGPKERKDRIKRAYRFNHTKEVVDLINKYIFKAVVHRSEDAPEQVQKFWKNSTLNKRKIEHLMRLASKRSSIYGRPYVVIDSSKRPDSVTEKDVKLAGGRVYAYTVKPQNVLDIAFDKEGDVSFILLKETFRDIDDPITATGDTKIRYRLWTKTDWALFTVHRKDKDDEGTVKTQQGTHDLGIVPVVPLDHEESDELYTSTPLIADIAYMDRAAANYLSNLDAIIQDQTFSQLTIPSQAVMPQDDEAEELRKLGSNRIFTYNGEAGQKPEFISPDVKQAKLITDTITKIIGEIYHSVGMAGERTKQDNSVGIDNSSGVAKAYDFERMNAMLAHKANALQMVENKIARIVMAWHGKLDEEVPEYVTYPETFDVRSLFDEFDTAVRLSELNAPKLLRRKQMKVLNKKLYPQAKAEEVKKLEKEIDEEWLELDPQLLEGQVPPVKSGLPGKDNSQGQVTKDEPGKDK